MRSSLGNLVLKEVKELLRDPKILLGVVVMPLLMFPLMGAAVNISQTSVQEAAKTATIAMLDLDGGAAAQNLRISLAAISNVTILEVQGSDVLVVLDELKGTNITSLLVIPSGFSDNITNALRARVEVYALFKSISLAESGKAATASTLVSAYENLLVLQTVQSALNISAPQAVNVLNPIDLYSSTVIKGKVAGVPPSAIFGVIMSQSMMLPMVIMVMLIYAMQIAATSIAIEKEEKTLETLLTLPVGRMTILTGKLAGSIAVAAAASVAYMAGFSYYISSAVGGISAGALPQLDLQALGLAPTLEAYVLLGLTMFVTITSALALAISLAVFAENVRSAQSLVGFLILPIMIPSIVLMFADIDILPFALQAILYAIPYSHTILAAKALFMGDYLVMVRSIAYISVFTVAVLYVAARIFTTERVVTARISPARFRLGWRRRGTR